MRNRSVDMAGKLLWPPTLPLLSARIIPVGIWVEEIVFLHGSPQELEYLPSFADKQARLSYLM